MTEYNASPDAIRDFVSSHERTAYWVQTHTSTGEGFLSPSVLPSELPPSSPPSEADSSHSLPPVMLLRYPNGKADIPISHWHYDDNSTHGDIPRRRDPGGPHGHSRSRSHNPVLDSDRGRPGRPAHPVHHHRQRDASPPYPHSPEEIRVWPSDSDDVPQTYPRSKSLPRDVYVREVVPPPPMPMPILPIHPVIPPVPLQDMYPSPPPLHLHHQHYHHHHHQQPQIRPNLRNNTVPQPRPIAWHALPPSRLPQTHHTRPPPAMVYTPGPPQRFNTNHAYAHHGPEGMRHTRSAPVRSHGAHEPPLPVIPATATSLSSVDEEKGMRGRPGSRPQTPGSGYETFESGSTYYVVPTPGQKSHGIPPEKSLYTATSTTKSGISPSLRKPFFHRLFDMFTSTESSRASSTGSSRRLHRRHSTGRHRANEHRR